MTSETTFIEAGGHRTRLLDVGRGNPVVVLHGWGGRIESMSPLIDCLRSSSRVLAFDLPGFGESKLPEGVWGTPDYAAFIRDALGSIGVRRAHFLGHSYGAKTSLYLAATHTDLVDKLVLMGSPGLRNAPSLQVRVKRVVSRTAKWAGVLGPPGRAARDAIFNRIASRDYLEAGALRPVLVKVVNEDLSHLFPRITAPTLLVWGARDDSVPVAHARRMEQLIPDAGLVLFEGAGHFAYLDEPDRACRIIRHFFGVPVA